MLRRYERVIQKDKQVDMISQGHLSAEDYVNNVSFVKIKPMSKEALLADHTVMVTTAALDQLVEKGNLNIQRSEGLAVMWRDHLKQWDEFVKSLKGVPWKKVIGYSACIMTVLGFFWKMGTLRGIPNFLSNTVISSASGAISQGASSSLNTAQIPKPESLNFKDIMDSPLTPMAMVTIVGGFTITLGAIKAILWTLNKLLK